ncbi:MAG: hypothetical protein ABIG96_03205 [Candidatus Micrarchaeota archaeon]
MLIGLIFLLAAILLGYAVSWKIFKEERFSPAILFGIVVATWVLFAASMLFGFGEFSIAIAAIICYAAASYLLVIKRQKIVFGEIASKESAAVAFIAFVFFFYSVHVGISLNNGFSLATQDYAFHLGIMNTISQGNFPPVYPNYSQAPLSYYYFIDFFGAALVGGGMGLFFAFELIIALLMAAIAHSAFVLARKISGSTLAAILALGLLLLIPSCVGCQPGGAAFFSIFSQTGDSAIPKCFPIAPLLPSFPLSQPPIAVGFLCIFVLLLSSLEKISGNKPILLGVLVGLTAAFHVYFFLAMLAIAFAWLLLEKNRESALLFGSAFIFGALQILLLFKDKAGAAFGEFIKPNLFAYSNNLWDLFLFWLLNAGPHMLLAVLGILVWKGKNPKIIIALGVCVLIFLFGNAFNIAPYNWDSNKLFLPLLLLLPVFGGIFLNWLFDRKLGGKAVFGIIALFALASAYYQTFIYFTPALDQTPVKVSDAASFDACIWMKANIPVSSIVLAGDTLEESTCIYAVGGRKAFYSVPFWVRTHGFNWDLGKDEQKMVLNGDLELASKFGISHVMADRELEREISPKLREKLLGVYSKDGVNIYRITEQE